MTERTIVIGGGLAGLLAARRHARAGAQVTVLEATDRLGGALRTETVAGARVELGAEAYATASGTVDALLEELGLQTQSVAPATGLPSRLVSAAGTHRAPADALLGIPAHPFSRDVRAVIGLAGSLRASMDRFLPASIGTGDHISIGDCVRRRMGRRVRDRLVAPLVGGVHSADPARLELTAVSPGLLPAIRSTASLAAAVAQLRGATGGRSPGTAVRTLRGGMSTLTDALAADLRAHGGSTLTGCAVTAIDRRADGSWQVRRADAETDARGDAEATLAADHVVLACAPDTAQRLLAGATPEIAAAIPDAPASPVRLAVLVLDVPALDTAPSGTGALVAPGTPGVRAKALTHASAKWQHLRDAAAPHHVLRLSYGRPGETLPDVDGLVDRALADASSILGVRLHREQLVEHRIVTWPGAMRQRGPGHSEALRRLDAVLARRQDVELCGSWRSGTGIAALVRADRAADLSSTTRHIHPTEGLPA